MPKRKPLYERLKFQTAYETVDGKYGQKKGYRKLVLDWGSNVRVVGNVFKMPSGNWVSSHDPVECRGYQHLFNPDCLDQSGKTIKDVKEKLMEAFKQSVIENEMDISKVFRKRPDPFGGFRNVPGTVSKKPVDILTGDDILKKISKEK